MYIQSMNDGLSDDIKKKFMLPLTIEPQDRKEKVFHNGAVSPIHTYEECFRRTFVEFMLCP